MSAVAVLYTSKGFVMAADGRSSSDDDAKQFLITDEAQKIFPISGKEYTLALTITGLSASDDGSFNTYKEAMKHAADLSHCDFRGLINFAGDLCERLNNSFNQIKERGVITEFPEMNWLQEVNGWGIASLVLAGYFRGEPSWVAAHFFHYSQSQSAFVVSRIPIQPGLRLFLGSVKIREFIYPTNNTHPPDARFLRYIRPPGKDSLGSSAEIAKAFIEAHCDAAALQEDHDFCRRVGGHIHILEITPRGFCWRIRPKAKDHVPAVGVGDAVVASEEKK